MAITKAPLTLSQLELLPVGSVVYFEAHGIKYTQTKAIFETETFNTPEEAQLSPEEFTGPVKIAYITEAYDSPIEFNWDGSPKHEYFVEN